MSHVICGRFKPIRQDPKTGIITFHARLTPAPTGQWRAVFQEYQAEECAIGNVAEARIDGESIEFEAPDLAAKAKSEVIRRCIERTNPEAAKREAARQQQSEAENKRANREWIRVQEKYREGL